MHQGTTVSPVDRFDLGELTVEKIQAAYAAGTLTAEALTQACIERIATFNPRYNAIILHNPDALAAARRIDERRAAGDVQGPLAGVPIVVKDTMDMAGLPTTAGWSLLCGRTGGLDLLPMRDSTVVARMRAAGAIILGKTNVPVLSHSGTHANDSWAGPTYNAAAPAFAPGGSSAGTATAVAASMAVFGLAEETGGSIQNPAAVQALVGIKPTLGLVPMAGVMPLCALRDVVGPIARCVRDAALALDALAGYSAEDPKTVAAIGQRPKAGYTALLGSDALRGKRIGLYGPGWRDQPLCAETLRLYQRSARELEALGAVLVEDPFRATGFAALRRTSSSGSQFDERGLESLPYDLQQYLLHLGPGAPLRSFRDFAAATAAEDPFAPGGVLYDAACLPEFAQCRADPGCAPQQSEFIALKERYLEIFAAVCARERLDALIFPQMREEPPALFAPAPIRETTVSEINIAGLPAVTVPAGYYASGVPFALIIVGSAWSEAQLLACAYAYECATQHRRAPVLGTI